MSKGGPEPVQESPIRINFKIDSKANWNILKEYNLAQDPPGNAIPKIGEFGIVVDQNDMQIYCGISPQIKWDDSLVLFDGPKSPNNKILYYFDNFNTEYSIEDQDTFVWNSTSQKFEIGLSAIVLSLNASGVVEWNQSEERWETNSNYIFVPSEFNGGLYNTNLVAPSFAGQSLNFGSQSQ